jgi:hypothetical protein
MLRLLVIACSQKKTLGDDPVPAIERYDGPAYRVLRKYLREFPDAAPTVLILSAKFGLIPSDHPTPPYDCRLSKKIALDLPPRVMESAREVLGSRTWNAIAVCAGRDYRIVLDGFESLVPPGAEFVVLQGGQGTRLTNLKKWLLGVA